MKILISYFYQVRNFKPYMIPFSTAKWDPKWYHGSTDSSRIYKDTNNVWNGLKILELRPGVKCNGLCSGKELCDQLFGGPIPDQCLFLKEYKKQLDGLDFKSIINILETTANQIKEKEGFKEEPVIVLLVHEAPNNPCSERDALKKWFAEHDYILDEFRKEDYNESND